jgi:hypothetical protein
MFSAYWPLDLSSSSRGRVLSLSIEPDRCVPRLTTMRSSTGQEQHHEKPLGNHADNWSSFDQLSDPEEPTFHALLFDRNSLRHFGLDSRAQLDHIRARALVVLLVSADIRLAGRSPPSHSQS